MGNDLCAEAIGVAKQRLLQSGATDITIVPSDLNTAASHIDQPRLRL